MVRIVFQNKNNLTKEIIKWHCPFNLPRHSAVVAEINSVEDVDADVDEWHCPFNLPGHSALDAKVDRIGNDVDERNYQVTRSL